MLTRFSPRTIKALASYVYVYSDPDTREPFYVGKGRGNRVFDHLKDTADTPKAAKIRHLLRHGKEPLIEILVYGLDEETALKVEAAAIDLLGIDHLTNEVYGFESKRYGRITVEQLEAQYHSTALHEEDIVDNLMMIRISNTYSDALSPLELYEMTRGFWRVDVNRAREVDYVLAVYQGIVREVYKVVDWFPGGTTFMQREEDGAWAKDRYEFVGRIADEPVRQRYRLKKRRALLPERMPDADTVRAVKRKQSQKSRRMSSTPGSLLCVLYFRRIIASAN